MPKLKNLVIHNAIFCEEVRQEKSGKYLLIGVFPSDINIAKLPGSIPVAIYIEGAMEKREGHLSLRLSGPGEGVGIIGLDYRKEGSDSGPVVALATPRFEVLMEQEGTFKIEVSEDDKNWLPLIEKKVAVKDNVFSMFSSVFGQPSEQSPPDAPETS